jgi:hypothetical protein
VPFAGAGRGGGHRAGPRWDSGNFPEILDHSAHSAFLIAVLRPVQRLAASGQVPEGARFRDKSNWVTRSQSGVGDLLRDFVFHDILIALNTKMSVTPEAQPQTTAGP